MKVCKLALVIFAIAFISGCSKTQNVNNIAGTTTPAAKATATPDEFASERANYAKHCETCHGVDGEGGVVKVDEVKLKVPSLTKGHALKHMDEDLIDQIENGGGGMPKFKDKLSAEEIHALLHFVHHELQRKQ